MDGTTNIQPIWMHIHCSQQKQTLRKQIRHNDEAITTVPFLVVAGLIEGYISPDPQFDLSFRIAVGVSSGLVFWLLLIFGLPWVRR